MAPPGPLEGLKVLELAGLAPAPFAGLILSDYGADVVRVDRRPARSGGASKTSDSLTRGKRSIALDLKDRGEDRRTFLALVKEADVLIEGYRPGVMESLDLGPDELQRLNPRLIYARLTGFQRTGKWATAAGHDINYLALSGSLHALGTKEKPMPPANLLGDFAGGGLTCVLGILLALHTRQSTSRGGVVEANMVDGASYLSTFVRHAQLVPAVWGGPRGENLLDGGSPFYQCYETKDGKFMALGALEPQFYAAFLDNFGLSEAEYELCQDRSPDNWPTLQRICEHRFRQLTRDAWCAIYDATDACVTPVLETILPTKVPVGVCGYPGLPESLTHRNGREMAGIKPGRHQEVVLQDWLKQKPKL